MLSNQHLQVLFWLEPPQVMRLVGRETLRFEAPRARQFPDARETLLQRVQGGF